MTEPDDQTPSQHFVEEPRADTPRSASPTTSANDRHNHDGDVTKAKSTAPRPTKRRRLLKWLSVLAILFVLLIIVVQVVLSSTLPKTIILSALTKALGMKAEAANVKTGWWGKTTVSDVRLSIPLDDGAFLETKEIRVDHTSLLMILITGLEIKSLQVDQPIVHLRQSAAGRWNALNLLDGLTASGGSTGGGATTGGGTAERPKIPGIDIRGATLQVTDRTGRSSRVGPLDFLGLPDETSPDLVWKYSLHLPNQISLIGRTVVGADWRNEGKVVVTDLRPLLGPFAGADTIPDVKLNARWDAKAANGIEARLTIESLAVAKSIAARGVVNASEGGGKVTVSPQSLEVFSGGAMAGSPVAALTGGSLVYTDGTVQLEKLIARAGGGVAETSGQVDSNGKTGELSVRWTGVGVPSGLTHSGSLTGKLGQNLAGQIEISAHVDTQGSFVSNPAQAWAGRVDLAANGPAYDDLILQLNIPQFTLAGARHQVPLDGLTAQFAISSHLGAKPGGEAQQVHPGLGLALEWAKLGSAEHLSSSGYFLPASGDWALKFNGSRWPLPLVDAEGLGIVLDLAGTRDAVNVHKVSIAGAETVVNLTGSYVFARPKPLEVDATLEHKPPESTAQTQAIGASVPQRKVVWGALAGTGKVVGTLDPVNLELLGEMQGLNVKLFDRDVGNLAVRVKGEIDVHHARIFRNPGGAPIQLLGGQWEMEAVHSFDEEASVLTINMTHLPLAEIGDLLNVEQVSGDAQGSWTVYIPTYQNVQRQTRVAGGLRATNVKVAGLEFDQIDARTTLERGIFSINPVEVRRLDGRFAAKVSVNLADTGQIEMIDMQLKNWPHVVPPMTYLTVNASAPRIAVLMGKPESKDVRERKMRFDTGPILVSSNIRVGDVDAGNVQLNANVDGRVVHVPLLNADLLGSTMSAQATASLDNPNGMTAVLNAKQINPHELAKLIPSLKPLSGSFDVTAQVGPSRSRNALEPLQTDIYLTSRDGFWRQVSVPPKGAPPGTRLTTSPTITSTPGIKIGNGRFRIFADLDETFSAERVVLADQSGTKSKLLPGECPPAGTPLAVNTMEAAGGLVEVWGRIVRNENDRDIPGFTTVSTHVRIGAKCIDLDQVIQAFQPDGKRTPGIIDAQMVLYGTTKLELEKNAYRARQAIVRPTGGAAGVIASAATFATTTPTTSSTTTDLGSAVSSTAASAQTNGPSTIPTKPRGPAAKPVEADDAFTQIVRGLQGEGSASLRKSDLGNIQIINFLYSAMRLGQDVRSPTGNGEVNFRIENSNAYITAFRYFNRGVEVRAVGEVDDIAKLKDAKINVTAFGSIRTLKDVQLPIVRSVIPDIDAILSALQNNGISVNAVGTASKPVMQVVLLSDLGQGLRELLVGDYRKANNK